MAEVSYSAMEAAQNGHDTFLSMKPCKWGHPPPRKCRRDSGACVQCYELRKRGTSHLKIGAMASSACTSALQLIVDRGSGVEMQAAERALVRAAEMLGSGAISHAQLTAALDIAPAMERAP